MIVDSCAWTGHWGTLVASGDSDDVVESITDIGAEHILLSPLDGVWSHDLHRANHGLYDVAQRWPVACAAPLLDPSLPAWSAELEAAARAAAPLVRLLPTYCGYDLSAADDCAHAVGGSGLVVWVQTRLEDPRHQHPRAVVPDVPAAEVMALARRHPDVALVIGGAQWRPILDLAPEILAHERVYADVSQADGMDSLVRMVEAGLAPRLLFGTHAPFFAPLAGIARTVLDLDEATAAAILGDNARRLFAL